MAFSITQPAKVEARANLMKYTSVPPNGWEPVGYKVNGTAEKYIVDTLGWNAVKIMGNVGIGDGSVRTLNNSSNQDITYTDNYFIAGDVSSAPWDQSRLTSAPPLVPAAEATNATQKNVSASGTASAQDNSSALLKIPGIQKLEYPDGALAEPKNTSTPEAKNVSQADTGNAGRTIALNDQYHSLLLGRPVDDLMYEYPLAPSVSAYFKLVGVPMPGGNCAQFSMKCIGYGY